jgi:hypothetical protein
MVTSVYTTPPPACEPKEQMHTWTHAGNAASDDPFPGAPCDCGMWRWSIDSDDDDPNIQPE